MGSGRDSRVKAMVAVLMTLLIGGILLPAGSQAAGDATSRPVPFIVNGNPTTIADAPWQVALIGPGFPGSGSKPADRYFCTGSLIAANLVVTAAHCLGGVPKSVVEKVTVLAGRTWLNQTGTGETAKVRRAIFPLRPDGTRRFRESRGSATWDVALLLLDRSLTAPVIKIAGASEAAVWTPGRKVRATGWGVTSWQSPRVSNRLRVAAQVILPEAVCRRDNGTAYVPKTMVCLGGSAGHSSTCGGDSGGPLVASTSAGARLVGLTSFGDSLCRGFLPSVDTRVAGDSIRSWVRQKSIEVTGVDPVGTGGTAGPKPDYCRVPRLLERRPDSARSALRQAGCRLDRIRKVNWPGYGKRRVVGTSLPQGWLAPIGFGIRIAITRQC